MWCPRTVLSILKVVAIVSWKCPNCVHSTCVKSFGGGLIVETNCILEYKPPPPHPHFRRDVVYKMGGRINGTLRYNTSCPICGRCNISSLHVDSCWPLLLKRQDILNLQLFKPPPTALRPYFCCSSYHFTEMTHRVRTMNPRLAHTQAKLLHKYRHTFDV